MRSNKVAPKVHEPSIFSEQSYNQIPHIAGTDSYEIEQEVEMMIHTNQILQQISAKNSVEVQQLLNMNLTIVQQIMKNKVVRGMRGQKMMKLAICQLIILIKQNTLALKHPQQLITPIKNNYKIDQNFDLIDPNNNFQEVLEEIDGMRKSISYYNRPQGDLLQRTLDKMEKKLKGLFQNRERLQFIKSQNQKLLSQERAIRQLLEQQIQDYEKQVTQLKDRFEIDSNNMVNQIQKLRDQSEAIKIREKQLINELRKKQQYDVQQILGSDILPMLLVQSISLEQMIDNS